MIRELFVQPHLDDVALSAGGTVALAVEPVIATVFCRAPARGASLGELARELHRRWGGDADSVFALRRCEDEAAARVLDAHPRHLCYEDAIYRGYTTIAALRAAPGEHDAPLAGRLAAELVALRQELRADRAYLPLGVGGHVDHRICHAAGAALRAIGAEVWYYEDFPYVTVVGALADRLAELGRELAPITIDITSTYDRRVAAIAAYASQLPTLFRPDGPFPGPYDALLARHAGALGPPRAERFWIEP